MLDNFKPATPKRPTNTDQNNVTDDDVLSAFNAPSTESIENATAKNPVAKTEPIEPPTTAKFRVKTSNPSHKKRNLLIFGGIAALIVAAGAGYMWFTKEPVKKANETAVVAEKKVEKAKIYSPLSGVEVATQAEADKPVTGIMIENSPDARPQSGLDQAGIVFEAIAEGGITRFLALYQEGEPDYIGPVRSARPYYVEFAKTFDATYAHVGGSPDALSLIKTIGVKDIDQFANGNSYYRINSRAAPHNVYTDFTKLDALNVKKGYTVSKFTPWERKVDVKQTPTASIIDLSVSGPTYSPRFTYDSATNSYLRIQEGEPHNVIAKDGTKKQINPKTVVVLVTSYSIASNGKHSIYRTTGSGKMYVFQDGIVSIGTWSKADGKTQFVFTDKNGLPMKFNRGQTWVTLVASDSSVSYKP